MPKSRGSKSSARARASSQFGTEFPSVSVVETATHFSWNRLIYCRHESETRPLKGAERIAAYLKTLPDQPGVYRMLNAAGDVLYVGKAKSLKKRVAAYARGGVHSDRLTRMVAETAEMLFVTTASETEALLLESNLIKQLKPRYNVSYRDDKSFPNILLREDHPFPQLLKHRGAKSAKGIYFGPFASAGAVTRTLNTLQRAFLLRSCSDSVFASRTRPCLLVPDQALQRALRRPDRRSGLSRIGGSSGKLSHMAKAAACRTPWSGK